MNIKKINMKKIAVSCATVCLTGALCWNTSSLEAWAAPTTGSAINDNTRVRSAIGGNPIGSLNANQEVKIKSEQSADDGYTWYEITFDWNGTQTDGWVRSDMISSGSDAADQSTTDSDADQKNKTTESDAQQNDNAQDGTFQIDGKTYEIADSFPSGKIPEGFEASKITYAGEEISAAKMKSGDVVLLYLQNTEDSNDKEVFTYDADRDEAVPFVSVAVQDHFIVVTNVPEAVASDVSDYYQETECTFDAGTVMAYQMKEAGDFTDSNADISDFYYVYGASSDGENGWYTYDSKEQTIQKSVANMQYQAGADSTDPQEDSQGKDSAVFELDSMTRMLTAGLGVVALLLLILFIATSVRYHRLRKYLDTEEFPEDEDDIEEDPFANDTTIGVDIVGSTVDIVDFDGSAEQKNKKKTKRTDKRKKEENPELTQKTETDDTVTETVSVKAQQAETLEVPPVKSQTTTEKESSPETEKLVADLKKMIQEVETTLQPDADDDDEFYDEEDAQDSEETAQEKKKKPGSGKKGSWDDIEFL